MPAKLSLTAAAFFAVALMPMPTAALAQSQAPAGLSGTVSSTQEGPMEGVVVSAKKLGSTITTSVATDDKGRFSFPAGRLVWAARPAEHHSSMTRITGQPRGRMNRPVIAFSADQGGILPRQLARERRRWGHVKPEFTNRTAI